MFRKRLMRIDYRLAGSWEGSNGNVSSRWYVGDTFWYCPMRPSPSFAAIPSQFLSPHSLRLRTLPAVLSSRHEHQEEGYSGIESMHHPIFDALRPICECRNRCARNHQPYPGMNRNLMLTWQGSRVRIVCAIRPILRSYDPLSSYRPLRFGPVDQKASRETWSPRARSWKLGIAPLLWASSCFHLDPRSWYKW